MSSNYNKHESKYFNTAQLMNEALLILLETKEYEYISISEICKKAGVNRSTFYLHYESMDDLLKETLERLNEVFEKKFNSIEYPNISTGKKEELILITPKYIVPYLEYIKENKKIFIIAKSKPELFNVSSKYLSGLNNIIYPILDKFNIPEKQKKYTAAFFISGAQAIVMEWVKNGCEDDIELVTKTIIRHILRDEKYGDRS